MNKKLKIVSSIALAGMLVTSSFGMNRVNAAETTPNYETNPVAIYRKLVQGKTVVPFVLANKDDVVTAKDIVESDLFEGKVSTINGTVVSSLDMVVKTGDKFTTTDGTEYTVIVYGDVDENGSINSLDALEVEKAAVGIKTLDDVQKEAADVINDGNVNGLDSLAIRKYAVGLGDYGNSVIDKLPEKEEVVEDSNYTLTLNDGGYINNVNSTNNKLGIDLNETLDKQETLKLVISDENESTPDIERSVVIAAHTDYIEVAGIDLSSLSDGTVTGKLYDGDKIVGTFEIVKNTVAPDVTNVRTNRVSTRKATLSLDKLGTSDITKVKYLVKGKDEDAPASKDELTNSVDVQNNKLTDATVAENLETNLAYKVYYVVENQYGSTSEIKEAVIANDSASVYAETKLESVKAPNLEEEGTAEFTWTKGDSKTYIATLYKDGNAIAEKETTEGTVDFTAEMKETGTYKVSVVVKGAEDGSTTNSEATESEEVSVSALKAVEGLTMQNDEEGNVVLSWTNPNGKDDFKAYEINLYRLDQEGKEVFDKTVTPCKNEENQVQITVNPNTIYVAKVKVAAKDGQMATISSEEVTSNQFYRVEAPNMDTAKLGSTSIKFTITPIEIPNKEVTYKVEVYDVNGTYDPTQPQYVYNSTKNVTVDENNQITVDGLTSLETYAFRLIATVDGNEVKSGYGAPITTLPVFDSVVVDKVEEASKENSNKVAVNGTKIVMNGAEYDTATIDELQPAKAVIEQLKPGDVVTMNDDATVVSLELDGGASAELNDRDFGTTALANSVVEIESNEYNKTIKGNFKSLTLKGTNSIFTVTDADVKEPIVLTDGVEVATVGAVEQNYKIEAGATAIINKIKVTTNQEVTLKSGEGKSLTVEPNETSNDLVFENSSDGEATIEFNTSKEDNASEQKGTVTIRSNGGKVTVTAPNVNVSAEMKVEVNNGTVDIKDPSLTGDKTVTVSADKDKTSTVVAKAETKAPIAMNEIELKAYTDEEIEDLFPGVKQDQIIAINQYINSFGLNGTGAKITVSEGSDVVTITLSNATNVDIGNLK